MTDHASKEVIRIRSLAKTYPGSSKQALCGIDLSVGEGEIITLLGPSGCGKTTALRLVAGLETPDAGEIYIQGRLVSSAETSLPPESRGLGMVFQNYALFPHMTAYDNISFALFKLPKKARRQRTEEVLELVGLTALAGRYPHELSGGQQQRVALARALAAKPAVVLLDEPFSNLDEELKKGLRKEVKQILNRERVAAIFVSHDQKDALQLSNQILVMKDGAIEQAGTPQQVFLRPRTAFVASFLSGAYTLPGQADIANGLVQTDIGAFPCSDIPDRGSQATVCLRPESLTLCAEGTIRGIVKSVSFMGPVQEVSVHIQGVRDLHEIVVNCGLQEDVKPGQHIRLQPDAGHIVVV